MPPTSPGQVPESFLYQGRFSKTRFLARVIRENPSARSPSDILQLANSRLRQLPAAVRDTVCLTDLDVHNTRTWLRAQCLRSGKAAQAPARHALFGGRVSLNRLVAMAMGQAGGLDAHPDDVLKHALGQYRELPRNQRPKRKPTRADVVEIRNEFENGRLQSLLPLTRGQEDPATERELTAAERFVRACHRSIDRARAVLEAYAVSS